MSLNLNSLVSSFGTVDCCNEGYFPCSTTRNAGSKDERGSHSTPLCVKGRMALQILFDIKANHVHWEKTTACMSDSTLLHRTASSCWRRGRSGGASTTDGCHQRECRTSALTGLLDGADILVVKRTKEVFASRNGQTRTTLCFAALVSTEHEA